MTHETAKSLTERTSFEASQLSEAMSRSASLVDVRMPSQYNRRFACTQIAGLLAVQVVMQLVLWDAGAFMMQTCRVSLVVLSGC